MEHDGILFGIRFLTAGYIQAEGLGCFQGRLDDVIITRVIFINPQVFPGSSSVTIMAYPFAFISRALTASLSISMPSTRWLARKPIWPLAAYNSLSRLKERYSLSAIQ